MAAESATTETVEKSGSKEEESAVEAVKGNGETTPPTEGSPAKPSPTPEEDDEPTPAKKRGGSSDEKDAPEEDVGSEEGEEDGVEPNLDDDEKVENPAYIPKTGRFYMHDDGRRVDVNDDGDDRRNLNKKSRADGDWKHDRFDEKFQRPKTKKQIVTKYGFDIRHKEGQQPADDKETTAPESTEEESSDARPRQQTKQKERRVVSSAGKGRGAPRGTQGRRPMKQREREDTVDESEGRGDEEDDEEEMRPAQKRQLKSKEERAPREERSREQTARNKKPTATAQQQVSSEDNEEEEEDDGAIRRGQRRSVPLRRGVSGGPSSRLRGRLTQGPPRRSSGGGGGHHPSSSPAHGTRQSPRHQNVRSENSRDSRPPPPSSTTNRREYTNQSDRNDDRFENHRRGVIRGASRGSGITRGYGGRGAAIRGGVRGSTAPRYGVRRTDTSEQSEGYHRGGSGTDYSSPRPPPVSTQQKVQSPQTQRSYQPTQNNNNSYRGSAPSSHPHPSANVYPASTRGNFSSGGHVAEFVPRGGHHSGYHGPPQHHHHQHGHAPQQQKRFVQGGGAPPPQMMGVPYGGAPPPQMTRGTTHGGAHHGGQQQHHNGAAAAPQNNGGHQGHGQGQQQQQKIRQPTDVVYFDPQQQQGTRQLPPRSKKVIPIVDPNKADQK